MPLSGNDRHEMGSGIQLVFVNNLEKTEYDNVSVSSRPKSSLDSGSSPHVAIAITPDITTNIAVPEKAGTSEASALCFLYRANYFVRRKFRERWLVVKKLAQVALLVLYLAYFAYAMHHDASGEPALRLLVGTVIGALILARRLLTLTWPAGFKRLFDENRDRGVRVRTALRCALYVLSGGGAVAFIVKEIALSHPGNLVSLAGLALFILIGFFISAQPDKINWHAVYWGMAMQFWFAVVIRRTSFGGKAFEWLASRVVEFLNYTDKGSEVVFGRSYRDHLFVFQMMPAIVFLNAAIVMLYHLGVAQVVVARFGGLMRLCLGTSPVESVNAAANLFLSLSESAVLVQPFLADLTNSELFAVMTGGFASIAGSLLATYSAFGAPIDHLLTASVMSAPAALAFAKLLFPDERPPSVTARAAYEVKLGHSESLLGALSHGASQGLKMASNVVINLLVYVAMLEFLNMTLLWFAERAGVQTFTFSTLLAYVFYPLTYTMGYEAKDCLPMSRLLGYKILTTTTLSYVELGQLITNSKSLATYVETTNGTWRYAGENIILDLANTTLVGGVVSERSGVLATYMLCGLSNLGSIGITIGGFVSLAPQRARDVISYVGFAFIAGNFASFSTACVAGVVLFTADLLNLSPIHRLSTIYAAAYEQECVHVSIDLMEADV